MMQGDDIRNHRQLAEKQSATASSITTDRDLEQYLESHKNLALWVIAEQLFELRSLIAISLERKN